MTSWFEESGLSAPVALVPINSSKGYLTRDEKEVAAELDAGEVRVRAVFVAFPSSAAAARTEAIRLFEKIVLRKRWEFWK